MFFAAIFHYFFLVGTLSIMNLVLFQLLLQSKKKETAEKKVNPKNEKRIKKKVIVHVIAFIINWGKLHTYIVHYVPFKSLLV